jgi:hypothetical protein
MASGIELVRDDAQIVLPLEHDPNGFAEPGVLIGNPDAYGLDRRFHPPRPRRRRLVQG